MSTRRRSNFGPRMKKRKIDGAGTSVITTTFGKLNLITFDEPETILRIVGKVIVISETASQVMTRLAWYTALGGVDISSFTTGAVLTGRDSQGTHWQGNGFVGTSGQVQVLEFDVKGKQKVYAGDLLQLLHVNNVANGTRLYFVATVILAQH